MDLLDKYIAEIGKHLPRKGRADIEAEIRSTLEDMLEERNQASAKDGSSPKGEEEVIALLKEYGEPRKVAESYNGPRYLISSRLYPTFELVTKIVMSVLVGVGLLGYFLSSSSIRSGTGWEILLPFGQYMTGLLGVMIGAFGLVVINFAILERVLPASEFDTINLDDWDPAELAKEADSNTLKRSEPIITIILSTIGLIVYNFYPELMSLRLMIEGEWIVVPILSDVFFSYLPWINVLGLLQIVFNLYLLRQDIWSTLSRLIDIILDVALIKLAFSMMRGPSLVSFDRMQITQIPESVLRILSWVPQIILLIVIVVTIGEISLMIYHLFKKKPVVILYKKQ